MTIIVYLTTLMSGLRHRLGDVSHELRDDPERGSFSLEQAVIAAALLALAIGLAAVLVAAVSNHESSIK
jgi:hypothetical protein